MTNNFTEKSTWSRTIVIVLSLLVVVSGWTVWLQQNQENKITQLQVDIQTYTSQFSELSGIKNSIYTQNNTLLSIQSELQKYNHQFSQFSDLGLVVKEQREILNATLGYVFPIKMPAMWERRLVQLEDQVSRKSSWPSNNDESDNFMTELSDLISKLSPLTEATYYERIVSLRWAAIAFEAMNRRPSKDEYPIDMAEELHTILVAKPIGEYSNLRELSKDLKKRADESTGESIQELINSAKHILNGSTSVRKGESQSHQSIEEIYDNLGSYIDNPIFAQDITHLRDRLNKRIREKEVNAQLKILSRKWDETKRLLTSHDSLIYETSINMLLHETTIAQSTAALQDFNIPVLNSLVNTMRQEINNLEDRKRREYQQWALQRIITFEDILDTTSEDEEQKPKQERNDDKEKTMGEIIADSTDSIGKAVGSVLEKAEKVFDKGHKIKQRLDLQNGIITYLLPIDPTLLAVPVLKRYQREFDRSWDRLKGHNEQTCVAIAAALVKKRTFDDIEDDTPNTVPIEGGGLWEDKECIH